MLCKTKGFVLNSIKYKETSLIANIYTEQFGLQSYIQNSVRKHNARTRASLFLPLTFLDLVVYHDEKKQLHRISELKPWIIFQTVHSQPYKIAVVSFVSELISKCVRENQQVDGLYEFVESAFRFLDRASVLPAFHIIFLIKLAALLGFAISNASDVEAVSQRHMSYLNAMIHHGFAFEDNVSHEVLKKLLDDVLDFYRHHIENFGTLKSLKVLREM